MIPLVEKLAIKQQKRIVSNKYKIYVFIKIDTLYCPLFSVL